jgi:ferredoxin/flavodoxin---NADP+ reductase
VLRFFLSPVAIIGNGKVEAIELVRNQLIPDPETGALRAKPTEEHETVETGIVFRSIGYRGTPLPGVPFDEARGTIPNDAGRVLNAPGGTRVRGEYVVGWIKRGPSGVIGTNKKDAHQTVDHLLEDLAVGALNAPTEPAGDAIEALLAERAPDHVTYAGWEAIDAAERAAGEPQGRPRVKLCSFESLLEAARLT